MDYGYLFGMALQTVPEPRKVARDLFALNLPRNALWMILGLLMVGTTFLGVIDSILFPVDPADLPFPTITDPIMLGVAEASIAVITVFAIYWVGRSLGGSGRFSDAIMVMIWFYFVALNIQIGVSALMLFAEALAFLLWMMGAVMGLWILSHFIAEMHGFASAGRVLMGIILTSLVALMGLSILIALIGIATGMTDALTGGLNDV